jgi:hypothetical protein
VSKAYALRVITIHYQDLPGWGEVPPCAIAGGYLLYRPAVVDVLEQEGYSSTVTIRGHAVTPTDAECHVAGVQAK